MALSLVNNYNTLGKVGPHYERPEYRPPAPAAQENSETQAGRRGDRSTLSTRNATQTVQAKNAAPAQLGRLTMEQAKSLISDTARLIQALPPLSTTAEPHLRIPHNLMSPVYA